MKHIKLLIIILLFFIFSTGNVFMSRIFYEYGYELQDIIQMSSFIVIAEKMTPFENIKEIKIESNIKNIPPFKRISYNFIVKEILYDNNKKLNLQEHIIVETTNIDMLFYLHKKYYLEGVLKSPIFKSYKTGADLDKDDRFILFIKENTTEAEIYKFVSEFSYEKIDHLQIIRDMIKDNKY